MATTTTHGDAVEHAGQGYSGNALGAFQIYQPVGERSSGSGSRTLEWLRANAELAADLIALITCLVIYAALETAKPHLTFLITSQLYLYSYPLLGQTVPAWVVPPIAFLIPVAVFWAQTAHRGRPRADVGHLVLSLGIAMLMTGAVTNCLKLAFSRPRPNFVAACWPSDATPVLGGKWANSFGGLPQCSAPFKQYNEHIKSFPSGHSSMSAAGLGFLTWYLLGQLKTYSGGGFAWRVVLSFLPALVAIAIGITRVTDYWHHPSDVMTGLALG